MMPRTTLATITVETPVERFPQLKFVQDFMNDYLNGLAMELGFACEIEQEEDRDGRPFYYLTPAEEDCILAARQPVSAAAVLADLCALIGIKPPATVLAALDDTIAVN